MTALDNGQTLQASDHASSHDRCLVRPRIFFQERDRTLHPLDENLVKGRKHCIGYDGEGKSIS